MTSYKKYCFGHFDKEEEACAYCNIAVECYDEIDT